MIAFGLGMLVSASILFIIIWVKSMLDMHDTVEGKTWGTDPAVPMPHHESARESREKAQGFRVAAAGKTFCYECGTPVGVHLDRCCACSHKLIWNA